MTVAAAVLTAGGGRRFGDEGDPKPLVRLDGRPLVSWALDAACASGLRPVVLVVGHEGRRVARLAPEAVIVTQSSGWRRGIAHSLGAALDLLDGWVQVDAVCVGLGDQPRIGAEAYRRLAAAHDAGAELAVATYGGGRSNPVLIARSLWDEAGALRGDEGARVLMRTHSVTEVPCDGTGDPVDVDTPEDLEALRTAGQEGSS
ncbi:MAG TPA: nucleotidyltransferase family protein [Acidimicrobiia bacterium]|nr:nucleotidyltransferase family protein [Acidimicrobiia bacterium]